jgi:hypothetical protein
MYGQARDRQSARGAANMLHDPYVNNAATTNVPRSARAFVARVSSNERSM